MNSIIHIYTATFSKRRDVLVRRKNLIKDEESEVQGEVLVFTCVYQSYRDALFSLRQLGSIAKTVYRESQFRGALP